MQHTFQGKGTVKESILQDIYQQSTTAQTLPTSHEPIGLECTVLYIPV